MVSARSELTIDGFCRGVTREEASGSMKLYSVAVKRAAIAFVCVFLVMAGVGCFRIEQQIDLSDPQNAKLTARLWVNKQFAGAEMDLFLEQLHLTVPAIEETADFSRFEDTGDIEEWVVYEWTAKEARSIVGMPVSLNQNEDGSYVFRYPIGPFDGFSEQTESDSIMMTVIVTLPKRINLANTMDVAGSRARWDLRKRDLVRGIELQAVTE